MRDHNIVTLLSAVLYIAVASAVTSALMYSATSNIVASMLAATLVVLVVVLAFDIHLDHPRRLSLQQLHEVMLVAKRVKQVVGATWDSLYHRLVNLVAAMIVRHFHDLVTAIVAQVLGNELTTPARNPAANLVAYPLSDGHRESPDATENMDESHQ